ncbi:serine-rich adhesin for platelets [Anabrus simplex]|uniref:serine-rich adhesin for platelets n=1 Tax=Anabrus simplex TaxID=316456 RepID=UPI0035A35832
MACKPRFDADPVIMNSDDDSPFPPFICSQAPPALLAALEDSTGSLQEESHVGVLDAVLGKAGIGTQRTSRRSVEAIYLADESDEHGDTSNFGEVFPDVVNKTEPIASFDSADSIRSAEASGLYKVDTGDCNETLRVLGLEQVCADDPNSVSPLPDLCTKDVDIAKEDHSDLVLNQASDSSVNQDKNISEQKVLDAETCTREKDNHQLTDPYDFQSELKGVIKDRELTCERDLLSSKSDPLMNLTSESKSAIMGSVEKSVLHEVEEDKTLNEIEKSNIEVCMENENDIENSVLEVIDDAGLSIEGTSITQANIDNDNQISTDDDTCGNVPCVSDREVTGIQVTEQKSILEVNTVCDSSSSHISSNLKAVGDSSDVELGTDVSHSVDHGLSVSKTRPEGTVSHIDKSLGQKVHGCEDVDVYVSSVPDMCETVQEMKDNVTGDDITITRIGVATEHSSIDKHSVLLEAETNKVVVDKSESSDLKIDSMDLLSNSNEIPVPLIDVSNDLFVDDKSSIPDSGTSQLTCVNKSHSLNDEMIRNLNSNGKPLLEDDAGTSATSKKSLVEDVIADAQVSADGSVKSNTSADNLPDGMISVNSGGLSNLIDNISSMSEVAVDPIVMGSVDNISDVNIDIKSDLSCEENSSVPDDHGCSIKEDSSLQKFCHESLSREKFSIGEIKSEIKFSAVTEGSLNVDVPKANTISAVEVSVSDEKCPLVFNSSDNTINCEKMSETNIGGSSSSPVVDLDETVYDNELLVVGIKESSPANLILKDRDSSLPEKSTVQYSVENDSLKISSNGVEDDTWKAPVLAEVTSLSAQTCNLESIEGKLQEIDPDNSPNAGKLVSSVDPSVSSDLNLEKTLPDDVDSEIFVLPEEVPENTDKPETSENDFKPSDVSNQFSTKLDLEAQTGNIIDKSGNCVENVSTLGSEDEKLLVSGVVSSEGENYILPTSLSLVTKDDTINKLSAEPCLSDKSTCEMKEDRLQQHVSIVISSDSSDVEAELKDHKNSEKTYESNKGPFEQEFSMDDNETEASYLNIQQPDVEASKSDFSEGTQLLPEVSFSEKLVGRKEDKESSSEPIRSSVDTGKLKSLVNSTIDKDDSSIQKIAENVNSLLSPQKRSADIGVNAKLSGHEVSKRAIQLIPGTSSFRKVPERTLDLIEKASLSQESSVSSHISSDNKMSALCSSVLKAKKQTAVRLTRLDNKIVQRYSNGRISIDKTVGTIVRSPVQPLRSKDDHKKSEASPPQLLIPNDKEKVKPSPDYSGGSNPIESSLQLPAPNGNRHLMQDLDAHKTVKDKIDTDTVAVIDRKLSSKEVCLEKNVNKKKVLDLVDKRRKIDSESLEAFMQRYGISKSSSKEGKSLPIKDTQKNVGKDSHSIGKLQSSDKMVKSLVNKLGPDVSVRAVGKASVKEPPGSKEEHLLRGRGNSTDDGKKGSVKLSSGPSMKPGVELLSSESAIEVRSSSSSTSGENFTPSNDLTSLAQKLGSYCSSVKSVELSSVNESGTSFNSKKEPKEAEGKISFRQKRKLSGDLKLSPYNDNITPQEMRKLFPSKSDTVKPVNSRRLELVGTSQSSLSSTEAGSTQKNEVQLTNLKNSIDEHSEVTEDNSSQNATGREFSKIVDPEVSLTRLFGTTLCEDTPVHLATPEPVEENLLELLEDSPPHVDENSSNVQTSLDNHEKISQKEIQEVQKSSDSPSNKETPARKRRRHLIDEIKQNSIIKPLADSVITPEVDTSKLDQNETPAFSPGMESPNLDDKLSSVRRVSGLVPSKLRSAADKELQKAERRLRYMKRKESIEDTPSPISKISEREDSLKTAVVKLKRTDLNNKSPNTLEKVNNQKRQAKVREESSVCDVRVTRQASHSNIKNTPSPIASVREKKFKEKMPSADDRLQPESIYKLRSSPRNTPSPLNHVKELSVEKKSVKVAETVVRGEEVEKQKDGIHTRLRGNSLHLFALSGEKLIEKDKQVSTRKRVPSGLDSSLPPRLPTRQSRKRKLSGTDIETSKSEVMNEIIPCSLNSSALAKSVKVSEIGVVGENDLDVSGWHESIPTSSELTSSYSNSPPPPLPAFTYKDLKRNVFEVKLPSSLWATQVETNGRFVSFSRMASNSNSSRVSMDKAVLFMGTCEPAVFFHEKRMSMPVEAFRSLEEVSDFLHKVHSVAFCHGTGIPQATFASQCLGYVDESDMDLRCSQCALYRKKAIVLCEMQTFKQVQFLVKKQQLNITDFVKKVYFVYFKLKLGGQDIWAPHEVCKQCLEDLRSWSEGLQFKVEVHHHLPNLASSIRPIPLSPDVPVPDPPTNLDEANLPIEDGTAPQPEDESGCSDVEVDEPQLFSQEELDDLEDNLVFCSDLERLMAQFHIRYDSSEWKLFIDSSKRSLKAVLLHNGGCYVSIPVAHSMYLLKTYENLELVLKKVAPFWVGVHRITPTVSPACSNIHIQVFMSLLRFFQHLNSGMQMPLMVKETNPGMKHTTTLVHLIQGG